MFCENCGNQIPDDSVFCEECGTRTEPDAPPGVQDNIPVPPPPAAPAYTTQQRQQQVPDRTPQPAGNYGAQPYSTKKTPVGLMIGIFAAVVVIGVGGFFGIRALIEKYYPASEVEVSPSESPSVSDSVVTPEIPEETPVVSDNVATPEIPEETPTPEPQQQDPYEDYRGYASGDEISIGDFFWFTEDVRWNGLPVSRTAITDFNAIAGFWKAHTETIPLSPDEGEYWKWFNAEISGTADQTVFTFHTKGFTAFDQETGLSYDISSDDGFTLRGSFSDGQLFVGDRDVKGLEISIKDFYTLDGSQYAVGEILYNSNEKEYIVLVRP